MCHANYNCTHDVSVGDLCHYCKDIPVDTDVSEITQMFEEPSKNPTDEAEPPVDLLNESSPDEVCLPLSPKSTDYLLSLLPTDFDFAWLEDKAPYEELAKQNKKRKKSRRQTVNDFDSYVINPSKKKPSSSRRAWRKALAQVTLNAESGLDVSEDAQTLPEEDEELPKAPGATPVTTSEVDSLPQSEGQPKEVYVEANESNPDGWSFTPGGPIDRRHERMVIEAVSLRSYSRWVNGKKRWFAYDGRPLNSNGRPVITEEEREAFISGRYSDPTASWERFPNTDLDCNGQPYINQLKF